MYMSYLCTYLVLTGAGTLFFSRRKVPRVQVVIEEVFKKLNRREKVVAVQVVFPTYQWPWQLLYNLCSEIRLYTILRASVSVSVDTVGPHPNLELTFCRLLWEILLEA